MFGYCKMFYLILVWFIKYLEKDLDFKIDDFNKKENYIRVEPKIRDIVFSNNQEVQHVSTKLPMVCVPKDYKYSKDSKDNILGGYLLNGEYYRDEIFKNKHY